MSGEKDLNKILNSLQPWLNEGDYVFCTIPAGDLKVSMEDVIGSFREREGMTVVMSKDVADGLGFRYDLVLSWITLNIHSSLEATGLTAAFSTALSKENISCNVIAAYYHDHIFVSKKDSSAALRVLQGLSK
jgi:hypothetical protein